MKLNMAHKIESNCYTWTHLHVLGVRVGVVLEVGHTDVGGVLGKHLLSAPVVGEWGLEETEKEHATYTKVSFWVCCCHWGMTRIGVWSAKEGGRSRVGVWPKWS